MLKEARRSVGITQEALGIRLGYPKNVAQVYVARWESGTRKIPRHKIEQAAKILKLKLEDLL